MTKELIEMARKAGGIDLTNTRANVTVWVGTGTFDFLVAFAKLIAEKEREACIAHAMTSAEKAIDVAIKLEREACAKVCEDDDSNAGEWHSETHVGGYFAKAIRARVQE